MNALTLGDLCFSSASLSEGTEAMTQIQMAGRQEAQSVLTQGQQTLNSKL